MANIYFKFKNFLFPLSVVILTAFSFSQDNSFIDGEMIKIQEEFTTDKVTPSNLFDAKSDKSLPQSELMQELMKPGNENLLNQIKGIGKSETIKDIENKIGEKKDKEELKEEKLKEEEKRNKLEREKQEEEEEKMKKAKATLGGLLFEDNYAYYQSIKDFYGYDIFLRLKSNNKSKLILSNSNYIIGPGDGLNLTVWGDTEFQRSLSVNNDGTVYIKNVGVISVHGYTLSELQRRFKKILTKRYRTINPPDGKPTTFFDISLSKLKSINIFVNGEVVVPGSFNLNSQSTILDALKEAKGVTAKGTLRDIILLRSGKMIKHLDIYDYLTSGKSVSDINLKNGDNIFVGSRLNTVSLIGETLKPLKYELKPDETLKDIIKYSGGLLPTAAIDRIKIERLLPFEQRTSPVVTTKIYDMEFTMLQNGKTEIKPIKLYTHDVVTILTVPKLLSDFIAIGGAVYRKGRYSFKPEMTVNDLISKCGGYLSDAYLRRVELIRTYQNAETEYISLDLTNGDMNFELNAKDSILIHSEWNLKSKKIVVVSGYIPNPGFYYLHDSTRVSDLIFSKGGLEDRKQQARTFMKRADLIRYNNDGLTTRIIPINLEKVVSGDESEDILIEDRDHLRIYGIGVKFTEPKVRISGRVNYGSKYQLSTDMTIEDLILKAHGFKEGAFKESATVFRMVKNKFNKDSISQSIEVKIDKDFFRTGVIKEKKFFLQNNDHVVIRKNPDYEMLRTIYLTGEIKFPGVYSLLHKNETLKNIIERAGGLTSEAFIEGAVFTRDTISIVSDFKKAISGNKNSQIIVKNGDNINIPKHPGTVSVEGFVYTPGLMTYRKDWSLGDYIEAAGGARKTLGFKIGEVVVYYPGGNAKVDGWFFSPKVKEGSLIVINRIEKEPDSQWRSEVRSWLGIVTSTITVLLLISKM